MTDAEIYEAAAKFLESGKKNWNRHASARGKEGTWIDPKSPHAISWCAAGAISAVVPKEQVLGYTFWDMFVSVTGQSIVPFNDNIAKDKRDVIRALRKTAKYIRSQNNENANS